MQVDYKRDLNHSYMIVKEEKEPDIASYQIRMLQTNSIEGLLACRMQKMNTQMLYYYDISSRQALRTVYEHRQVGYQTIKLLFQQLIEVVEELEEYLLDPEGLLLTPNTVYFTAEPPTVTFCYLPGNRHPIRAQMAELMEYLLSRMNHQESEAVVLGYDLYREISSDEWSIDRMKSILLRKPEVSEESVLEEESEESGKREEEQEDMRKKAMESFFEEEEEEKESPLWTAAALAGGTAVLGLILYLMYTTKVPAVMYLIMLAAAGFSVLTITVWMKRREQQEREKEMTPFLKRGEEDEEKQEEPGQQPRECPDKREGAEQREMYVETDRKPPESVEERKGLFSLEYAKNSEKEEERVCSKAVRETQTKVRHQIIADISREEEHWKRKQVSPQQFYQKTEPLYRCPDRESFRLIPVSDQNLPQITVSGEELTVGKLGAVVDVVLPFPTVSRLHARIQCTDGRCRVTDLNSTNGTYVNEVRLESEVPCELEEGDEVSFADIRYQVPER